MTDEKHPNKIIDANSKTLKAGGVITRCEGDKKFVLLLHRKEMNDLVFPKGHVEVGEDPYQTAVREIKEEVGLDVSNGIESPDIEYKNAENPNGIIVKMYLFKSDIKDLQAIEEEGKPYWVPIYEVENKLSYKDLKDYFRSIAKYL